MSRDFALIFDSYNGNVCMNFFANSMFSVAVFFLGALPRQSIANGSLCVDETALNIFDQFICNNFVKNGEQTCCCSLFESHEKYDEK